MHKHLVLLAKLSRADVVTLLGIIPFIISLYLIGRGEPELALLASVAAFFFDSIDGAIARYYGIESTFGRQLDSSLDMLIYLVFPAYFVLQFMNPWMLLTILSAAVMVAFGILRLIRFNIIGFVYKGNNKCYPGLGTAYILPVVAVLYIAQHYMGSLVTWLVPFVLLGMSFAMISEIPIKKPRLSFWYSAAIAIATILIALYYRWL